MKWAAFLAIHCCIVHQSLGSSQCQVDIGALEKEKDFAHINFFPDLSEENGVLLAEPATVVIFTCKYNVYRYKHRCNKSGKWDLVPGEVSCARNCADPQLTWSNWEWNCDSPSYVHHSACSGKCTLDSTLEVSTKCEINGQWSEIEDGLCTAVINSCPDPYEIWPYWEWVDVDMSTYKPDSIIMGKCDQDSSEVIINCSDSGHWIPSKELVSCLTQSEPCPANSRSAEGKCNHHIECEDLLVLWPNWDWECQGLQCIGTCTKGNAINVSITCNLDGRWNATEADLSRCHANNCSDPASQWPNWKWSCESGQSFLPGTDCFGKCRNTDLRVQVTCQDTGEWEASDPGSLTLENCQDEPYACQGYYYNPEVANGNIFCHVDKSGFKRCVLNCDPGYVASGIEIYSCDINQDTWSTINGEQLPKPAYVTNLTCERPIVAIAGGYFPPWSKSVELYHPTRSLNISIPDLPSAIYYISGFWLNGKLVFCGQKLLNAQLSCYQLQNSLRGLLEWREDELPLTFVRSSSSSFVRPKNSWMFYAISSNDRNVISFDTLSSTIKELGAFKDNLDHHCAFKSNDGYIHIINSDKWFHSTENEISSNQTWSFVKHGLNLVSHVCSAHGDSVIITDLARRHKEIFLCEIHLFECKKIVLHELDREGSQLAELDGVVHLIGGSETKVDQLKLDPITNEVTFSSAPNRVTKKLFYFSLVEMAESFFFHERH